MKHKHKSHPHMKHEMDHHKHREMQKKHHHAKKMSEYHEHSGHMHGEHHMGEMQDNRMVKDSHQEGISRVKMRKGELEVGQHGSMAGGWRHDRHE